MKQVFKVGDAKEFVTTVKKDDIAAFESGTVHAVYSTFALARDAEWSGRLFVLEMKDANEEGIGTHIEINHLSPAFVGDEVKFISKFEGISDRKEIITSFEAFVGSRLIAQGKQAQKILNQDKLNTIFVSLNTDN